MNYTYGELLSVLKKRKTTNFLYSPRDYICKLAGLFVHIKMKMRLEVKSQDTVNKPSPIEQLTCY